VSRAKPKSIRRDNVTLDRVYRRLLALEKSLGDQLAINRIAIESTRELLKSIVYNSKESREDNLATLPSIREAILDTTQMMHLYQTHFDDLAKNFGAGAISRCRHTAKWSSSLPIMQRWRVTLRKTVFAAPTRASPKVCQK